MKIHNDDLASRVDLWASREANRNRALAVRGRFVDVVRFEKEIKWAYSTSRKRDRLRKLRLAYAGVYATVRVLEDQYFETGETDVHLRREIAMLYIKMKSLARKIADETVDLNILWRDKVERS